MTVVFDKLSFMRHLESEGTFARPQAEKLSEAFHQAVQETVATHADIARLEAGLARLEGAVGSQIARLEGAIAADVARLDARIDSMDARVDAKLASVDAKLAGVDAKMVRLEAKLDAGLANSKVWTVGVGVALFSALSAIRFFGH